MSDDALQRLTISVAEPDAETVAQALGFLDPTKPLEVQFNPTEYSLEKGSNLAEIAIPGLELPLTQFVHGTSEKLSLELLFDVSRRGAAAPAATDVRELTGPIERLARLVPKTHAPPRLRVEWGGLSFTAVAESVQQRFTLFSPQGVPLRARVTVNLRRYETLRQQLERLGLQSVDHTRTWRVRRGDSLASIAWVAYGDARLWRHVADHNERAIPDPWRLEPGALLALPSLPTHQAGARK